MGVEPSLALAKFGLGARPGDALPEDPRAWLRGQITAADPDSARQGPSLAEALGAIRETEHIHQSAPPNTDPKTLPNPVRDLAQAELERFFATALTTGTPFRERLVWFWANHFTVSARSRPTQATLGCFVREAIRPHVGGTFRDMLLAVMRHPAMLAYLDQMHSAGPNSRAGQRRHVGLNENLARECLELHTVTPAAGYTQEDVTSFARVLTGWSYDDNGFLFRPNLAEPGEKTVLGRRWEEGEAGGVALLEWLGTHPATYRHLAEKLARHFIADDPPPFCVGKIAAVLSDTGGDLRAATETLIRLNEAWMPRQKLRAPVDYVVAAFRATGAGDDAARAVAGASWTLGQPPFRAPFPIGWPDRAADWASPEAMLQRAEFAYTLAGRFGAQDPLAVGEALLGPLLSEETRRAMGRAGSRRDAGTLLLASADFQRR